MALAFSIPCCLYIAIELQRSGSPVIGQELWACVGILADEIQIHPLQAAVPSHTWQPDLRPTQLHYKMIKSNERPASAGHQSPTVEDTVRSRL